MRESKLIVLKVYWTIMTVGYLSHFAIFTGAVQATRWDIWMSMTIAIGSAGMLMTAMSHHAIIQNSRLLFSRTLPLGIAVALTIGLCMTFCSYVGYLIFVIVYTYWLVLLVAIVYYGIRIIRLGR